MDNVIVQSQQPNELVVRDADGKFKILRNGTLEEWTSRAVSPAGSAPASPGAPATPALSVPAIAPRTPPTSAPKPVSRHYVDVSDEEEIAALKNDGDAARTERINARAGARADAVIQASRLPVSEEVRPRLWRALVSRIKDVRDLIETKDVFTRAIALGGVGLEAAPAQLILKRVEDARAAFEEEIRARNFTPEPRTLEPETPTQKPAPLSLKPETPIVKSVEPQEESGITNKELGMGETAVPGFQGTQPPYSRFVIPDPSAHVRPQMQEVRARPRVVGPVEELGLITLEDFRRLAPVAPAAADKVREKVELLTDESLLKRSEGVAAWKSSPVHQLYLAVGRECMEKGGTVKQVILDWQARKRAVLTPEEFDAIADVNQKLAY